LSRQPGFSIDLNFQDVMTYKLKNVGVNVQNLEVMPTRKLQQKINNAKNIYVDVDVEWMYELRQSPLCPPQTYTAGHKKKILLFFDNSTYID